MVLKYVVSPYPTLLENMVVKIWEAATDGPGAEVATIVIPERNGAGVPTVGAGHQVPYVLTQNGLDTVVHIVRMYSAVSLALLHEYNVEPRADLVTIFDPIRFKIGDGGENTPAADTNTYQNDLLIGLAESEYFIIRNNYGELHPTLHYTIDTVAGSFTLVGDDTFNDTEEFSIHRNSRVTSTVINDSVVGKWFGGFFDINANIDYDPTLHLKKLGRFVGTCEFTFPLSASIPIGWGFAFNNFGNPLGTGTVNFLNAPLKWGATTKSELEIPAYTEACFTFDGSFWNVVYFTDTSFANEVVVSQPPNKVMGCGTVNIGDVPAGDPAYEVIHNLGITGDYNVFLSIKSNAEATYFRNNKIGSTWWHHETVGMKPNRFKFSLQEISGETQTLSVSWLIIKL